MKRAGDLFEQIADMDNLRLAYLKAKRGKEARQDVYSFSKNYEKKLLNIRDQLLSGNIKLGNYHYFTIYEPKERLICAAPFDERVLHHAIINITHPVFERFQIFDSYATRPCKGQFAALERAKLFHKRNTWFCKLDIRKYFDSVSHVTLMNLLERRFKDVQLLSLFGEILNSYYTEPSKGLPIGNLTSQYFANFFLSHADHYVKEKLNVKAYVRYMDDMVLWHNDKNELLKIRDNFVSFIEKHLSLEVKPACINRSDKGLPFLGYVIFPGIVRLSQNSKNRFMNKMKRYNNFLNHGIWTQKEFANHVLPLFVFTKNADTWSFRSKQLEQLEAG
jgi:retron-type reverse transcriptase